MLSAKIRDMDTTDEYFVSTCTHVGESDEIDNCARRRIAWFHDMHGKGVRVKVATLKGNRAGFLYAMPIELCPWGPVGRDLLVIPCLVVPQKFMVKGVGRALIHAAEEETRRQGRKGLVTIAYYHDFWFMPAPFFEQCGFSQVAKSRSITCEGEKEYLDKETLLWKILDSSAETPRFLKRNYRFRPVPGKVVIDLFWNTFCQTSNIEAERVRQVADEFKDSVVLHEYCADDRSVLLRHQIPRGIFINGKEIGWGYEAPKQGIREAISEALGRGRTDAAR